jgi:hypothetical protein
MRVKKMMKKSLVLFSAMFQIVGLATAQLPESLQDLDIPEKCSRTFFDKFKERPSNDTLTICFGQADSWGRQKAKAVKESTLEKKFSAQYKLFLIGTMYENFKHNLDILPNIQGKVFAFLSQGLVEFLEEEEKEFLAYLADNLCSKLEDDEQVW